MSFMDFRRIIHQPMIQSRITDIAKEINKEIWGRECVFLCVLNGAYMFFSDLTKEVETGRGLEVDFCKVTTYKNNEKSDIQFIHKWSCSLKGNCRFR